MEIKTSCHSSPLLIIPLSLLRTTLGRDGPAISIYGVGSLYSQFNMEIKLGLFLYLKPSFNLKSETVANVYITLASFEGFEAS